MLWITIALVLGLLLMKDGFIPALLGCGLPFELGFFLLCLFLGYIFL